MKGVATNTDGETNMESNEEHPRSEDDRAMTRRRLVTLAGGVVAVATTAAVGSDPAAASADAAFEAADVTIENNDGTIEHVSVEPEIDVEWENFTDGVERMEIELDAIVDEAEDRIYEETVEADRAVDEGSAAGDPFPEINGTVTYEFDRVDITDRGDSIEESTFSSGGLDSGETETTAVTLSLTIELIGAATESVTIGAEATFDVELTNPEGEATLSGTANTSGG